MLGVSSVVLRANGSTATTLSAQLIGHWAFDDESGATAADQMVASDGSFTNVALQQDPLVDGDPGTSVRFFGNSAVAVPHVAAFEVESYSVVVYGQVQSGPGPGANAILVQKDRPTLPGGFHVGIVNDSGTLRPQVYTKDATGSAIWVGSSAGVGEVVPGTAFMLVMTCGGSGTRVHLDKALIGSTNNHIDLLENDEQIGIGRYRPGVSDSAGFDGWIDEVRLYKGELTQEEIDALPGPQDLVIPPIEQETYTLPAVPTAPSGTTRYVSSGVGTGAPAAGDDSSGSGSIGNPYRTLSRALSVASSGDQIILRKGIYRNEANLNASLTNLTIKGYDQDIAADPLDPDSWPILDGGIDMSTVTWEEVDTNPGEYRTVQSNLVTGTQIGCAVVPGTASYQIPRWEPLGGMLEPRRMNRLPAYSSTASGNDWTLACFRHTGAVSYPSVTYYYGPGVTVIGGRVHIRLQPVHTSVTGGLLKDDYPDRNPANNQVFLWNEDRTLFSSVGNGFHFEGIFVRGYDAFYRGAARSDMTIRRNVFWGGNYQTVPLSLNGGTPKNFLFKHNVYVGGLSDWHIWGTGKHPTFGDTFGLNMGRLTVMSVGTTGGGEISIEDNLLIRVFDVIFGNADGATLDIRNNAIEVIDDVTQLDGQTINEYIRYNYVVGPLFGSSPGSVVSPNRRDVHHNVCVVTRWRPWRETLMWSWAVNTPHSAGNGRNYTIAHNTIIATNPKFEDGPAVFGLCPGAFGLRRPTSPEFQDMMNNILVVVNRIPPDGAAPTQRHIIGRWDIVDDRGRSDGNAYHKVNLDGLSGGHLFAAVTRNGGNSANFASLAAIKASAHFTASQSIYAPGFENGGIEADPQFVGGADAFVNEGRGVPPGYYIPQSAAHATGAIHLGSGGLNLGLPGYTYEAWRGALDPNGDGTEVGPRAA